ncbi:MAG: PD40 domain-containing protein [Candidatus Eisenbacteria sp.]|nr:PD40 domain-containing protein [Candidatus Eisenbacteria bacterium]
MSGHRWEIVMLLGVLLVTGCGSSDEGKTEFVFNPNALTFSRITTNPASDTVPAWNPAGTRLAFVATRTTHPELYITPVAELNPVRISSQEGTFVSKPSWSPNGENIAVAADSPGKAEPAAPETHLWVASYLTTLPQLRQLTESEVADSGPAWSPDNSRIVFSRDSSLWRVAPPGGDGDILETGDLTGPIVDPAWSPDGLRLAYAVFNGDNHDIYVQADGGSPAVLVASGADERYPTWSPSGGHLAYQSDARGNWDLWLVSSGGGTPINLTPDSAHDDKHPSWSPLGGTIAFSSNRGGNSDIWIMERVPFE